ncbi:MAG: TIGR02391 family protein [Elusimicrobiota bacterium]
MEINECIRLLKTKLAGVEKLKHPPAFHPEYMLWLSTVTKLLIGTFDGSVVSVFQGSGPGQWARTDAEHYRLFLKELESKRTALAAIIEEHESAEPATSGLINPNPLQGYSLHPAIDAVSGNLLLDGHYAQAIEEALKRVIAEVKAILETKGEPLRDGGASMIDHAMGCDKRTPPIRFNPLDTGEEINEHRGIYFLFKGIVGIRNRKAHENIVQKDPAKAVEYLCLASLLMRLLEMSSALDRA